MYLPSRVINTGRFQQYYVDNDGVYRGHSRIYPIVVPDFTYWGKEKSPGVWAEQPSEHGNNVHHAKTAGNAFRIEGFSAPVLADVPIPSFEDGTNPAYHISVGQDCVLGSWTGFHYDRGGRGVVINADFSWTPTAALAFYIVAPHEYMPYNVLRQMSVSFKMQGTLSDPMSAHFVANGSWHWGNTTTRAEMLDLVNAALFHSIISNHRDPSKYSYRFFMTELFIQYLLDYFQKWLHLCDKEYFSWPKYIGNQYSTVGTSMLERPNELEEFDEDNLLLGSGISSKPFAAYHLKSMRQAAFLNMLDNVPRMNDNNLQNIASICSFITNLVVRHRIDIPSTLSDAWLQYRYSYSTSKSDVEDAIAFVRRCSDLGNIDDGIKCHGAVSYKYGDMTVQARCQAVLVPRELTYFNKIRSALFKYGLTPGFYVVWDSIPYSFIVDWFIPVGDMLNSLDKVNMYTETYDFTKIWYSIKYQKTVEGCPWSLYTRWEEYQTPEFNGLYTLENRSVGNKTLGFRILDAISLTFK